MTLTRAREIMRDENLYGRLRVKYIKTYSIIKELDDFEVILYSTKTKKRLVVYDREDIGGFTGAHFLHEPKCS